MASTNEVLSGRDLKIDLLENAESNRIELYDGLGYVELVDMMPRVVPEGRSADIAITRAARTSYSKLEKKEEVPKSVDDDRKLIKRLWTDKHTSPFEMVTFTFQMRVPIYVERQLIRHRTAKVNEESARYSVMKDDFHLPELRMQSKSNKMGSSDAKVPPEAEAVWTALHDKIADLYIDYKKLIDAGVAREVARVILPVSLMTKIVWTQDLHNLLHFLRLRRAPDAQAEIQELANAIYKLIKPRIPLTAAAFEV